MRGLARVVALGAVALTAAVVPPAGAADKAKTDVSFVAIVPFGVGAYSYEGTIESRKKCADDRKVVVLKVTPGKNEKIGSTKANGAAGAWSVVDPEQADGTYYAKGAADGRVPGRQVEQALDQRAALTASASVKARARAPGPRQRLGALMARAFQPSCRDAEDRPPSSARREPWSSRLRSQRSA